MNSSSNPVLERRRAGVLLHVSSLHAGLGRGGRDFIDWLASAGFTVWQILPLGPTGAGSSGSISRALPAESERTQ